MVMPIGVIGSHRRASFAQTLLGGAKLGENTKKLGKVKTISLLRFFALAARYAEKSVGQFDPSPVRDRVKRQIAA